MTSIPAHVDWIRGRHDEMCRLVTVWSGLNSGTLNVGGLRDLANQVAERFAALVGEVALDEVPPNEVVDDRGNRASEPLGRIVRVRKRPDAPIQVLLVAHLDTVFAAADPFQRVTVVDEHTLRGPGVADCKGGIAVMLTALESFERCDRAGEVGWEVVLNPDEEIGSPGSRGMLLERAKRFDAGLVFEPALPSGALVKARKGSGNFSLVVRGRTAHAGRDFDAGRNAIHALASAVEILGRLSGSRPGLTVNVGRVVGGTAVNVVPDVAVARFNVRVVEPADQAFVEARLRDLVASLESKEGIRPELFGGFGAPPKPFAGPSAELLGHVLDCGHDLGLDLAIETSGGVCDGNRLAAAGLATVDSLGPCGIGIHTDREVVHLDTLTERARVAALLLTRLATREIAWPTRDRPAARS
ncbi:MAG: hydrolase [Deltaproteobacteria bacterium]|nr:hydrolase [Deltaproteobacteria bacterium]